MYVIIVVLIQINALVAHAAYDGWPLVTWFLNIKKIRFSSLSDVPFIMDKFYMLQMACCSRTLGICVSHIGVCQRCHMPFLPITVNSTLWSQLGHTAECSAACSKARTCCRAFPFSGLHSNMAAFCVIWLE